MVCIKTPHLWKGPSGMRWCLIGPTEWDLQGTVGWVGPKEGWVFGVGSHGLLEDLRVDASHTVDRVRPGDAQVRHVDALHRTFLHE